MGMPVKLRYPLPENSMQWLRLTRKRLQLPLFSVVKGKTKVEMLLGCDTAMELGVLKIVNSIDKEDKKLRPFVADIVSEYDCLFHSIGKYKHAKVKSHVMSCQVERRTPEVRRSRGGGVSAR